MLIGRKLFSISYEIPGINEIPKTEEISDVLHSSWVKIYMTRFQLLFLVYYLSMHYLYSIILRIKSESVTDMQFTTMSA